MQNIKLTIEYDGTHFNGWQVQGTGRRTVQGQIEKALLAIFKKKIKLMGSGRTDSGVHALAQVAHFRTETRMTPHQILKALNANLPDDISIRDVQRVGPKFHAQYSAERKTYRYTILNRQGRCAIQRNFCYHFSQTLNLRAMRQAAKVLVGRKDFRAFMATNPDLKRRDDDKNTVRTVYTLEIRKKGDFITINIEANGFLYKMVRNIVGTLLKVGTGKLPPGSLSKILGAKDRNLAGVTAPAKGLCLLKVEY